MTLSRVFLRYRISFFVKIYFLLLRLSGCKGSCLPIFVSNRNGDGKVRRHGSVIVLQSDLFVFSFNVYNVHIFIIFSFKVGSHLFTVSRKENTSEIT
jgi:hypothetical protein